MAGCSFCDYDGDMLRERKTFQTGAAKATVPIEKCPECDEEQL